MAWMAWDGMGWRWMALHGRARGPMVAWQGPMVLFICKLGCPFLKFSESSADMEVGFVLDPIYEAL